MTGEQTELDLTPPRARALDPATSHQAAASVRNVTEVQQAILQAYRAHGPMIDEQLHARLTAAKVFVTPSGCRTRRAELVAMGKVVDAGHKDRTLSGRFSIVWRAAA